VTTTTETPGTPVAGEAQPRPEAGSDGKRGSSYERYLASRGTKVLRDGHVPSLIDLELSPTGDGTSAVAVQLPGMEGLSSMEVVELPPGHETAQRRHLYEEYVLVLSGQGSVTFHGSAGGQRQLEWRRESVFAIPLNMRFTLRNTGTEPARLALINNAHLWMDLLGSTTAAFECELAFADREAVVLDESITPGTHQVGRRTAFRGPVFHDLGTSPLPEHAFIRGPGFGYLLLQLSGGIYGSHVGELPEGHISNAHWHMGGAVLIAMAGEGYTQAWPNTAGPQPPDDAVLRQEFRYSGAVSVGTGWFHLHANTGRGPLRQVAFRYGGGAGATFATVQGIDYAPGRVVDREDLSQSILAAYRKQLAQLGIPVAE
jgi:oxalate decarboxylase/phosphoglucose isomerase-like protein (cupin superfamily)